MLQPQQRVTKLRAFSSGGERFPDTEEVTSSNLVTPTTKSAPRRQVRRGAFAVRREASRVAGVPSICSVWGQILPRLHCRMTAPQARSACRTQNVVQQNAPAAACPATAWLPLPSCTAATVQDGRAGPHQPLHLRIHNSLTAKQSRSKPNNSQVRPRPKPGFGPSPPPRRNGNKFILCAPGYTRSLKGSKIPPPTPRPGRPAACGKDGQWENRAL